MNKQPDESTLISYLYGELTGEAREQVARYLRENPDVEKRLAGFGNARKALAELPDKEVLAPGFIFEDKKPAVSLWQSAYFRFPLGIAAAVLALLVVSKLLGLDIRYSSQELRIGFGKAPQGAGSVTEQRVNELIASSLEKNNEALLTSWSVDRQELENSIAANLQNSSARIDKLMKVASTANNDQVRQFVGQMRDENLKLMKDYMQLSSAGQKEYLESLLVDFSKYLQEQRKQDIQVFQTRMSTIEKNTDQFKLETEQLLTSLITGNPGNTQKRN